MRRSLNTAVGRGVCGPKCAIAWAVIGAFLFMCAPDRALAQAEPGPIPPAAGQQETGETPRESPPRQTMRPRLGAAPANPVELTAFTQELSGKLTAALEGWTDSSGAARKPKIIVLDFCTWDSQWLPFGAWLADTVSTTFSSKGATFELIDRAQLAASLLAQRLTPKDELDSKKAVEIAQSLGADIIVDGRFRAMDKDLGLTINARRALAIERHRPILFTQYRILMSDDISGRLGEPLDALGPKRDPYKPGREGVSYAHCKYCPAAPYSETGRKQKISGAVTLSVLVTAEGEASEIQVIKSLEPSLDQQAVKTVGTWKFEPARDASGLPVAVHQSIEISFHLY
jgi:TonB family protein